MHGKIGGLGEGQVYRGLSEMVDEFETVDAEAWEERRLEPTEFLHVVTRARSGLHGPGRRPEGGRAIEVIRCS
jgi:hypothetical protein